MSLTFCNSFKGSGNFRCNFTIPSLVLEKIQNIYDNNVNHTGSYHLGTFTYSQLTGKYIPEFDVSDGFNIFDTYGGDTAILDTYVGTYLTKTVYSDQNLYKWENFTEPYINTSDANYQSRPSSFKGLYQIYVYTAIGKEGFKYRANLFGVSSTDYPSYNLIEVYKTSNTWTVYINQSFAIKDENDNVYIASVSIQAISSPSQPDVPLGDLQCNVNYKIQNVGGNYSTLVKGYIINNYFYQSPIQYQWHSLTSLTSNVNGVQRTQGILGIRTDAIGDVDVQNTAGSLSNLLNPSGDNFNLSTTVRDMTVNATKEIYCGVGKCVITKTTATTATLEFYQANANTAFYTYNFSIANPLTSHDYIGFYIDTTNYKGYFNIISENLSTHVLTYNGISQTLENRNQFYTWLTAQPVTNPYSNNEVTTPQGGTNFAPRETEKIVANTFPTKSGLASGLFSIYVMTESDLQDFASELWDTNWVDNLDKKYTMPTDLFAGLFMLPFKARGNFYPNDAYQYPIKAGGVDFTAKGYTVTNRYVTFDMGCIDLKPQWDSYFDYKYSKCMIYLPFIGEYELSMSDLLTKIENENGRAKIVDTSTRIKLVYKLDVFTGILVAQILINGSIVYEFSGSCSSELPLTWNTRQAAVESTVNGIIGGVLLVGGVAAGLATAGVATTAAGAIAGVAGAFGAGVTGTQAVTKSVLNENKQEIHSTGKMGGLVGALGVNYPYITITTPNVVTSQDQLQMKGLPSFTKAKIKEYASDNGMIWPNSGYLNVAYIELNGYFGTEEEKEEIVNLLKGGVII